MTRDEILKIAKPIIFNTNDVRAILDERKSVTRRKIKDIPENTYRVMPVDESTWEAYYGAKIGDLILDLYEEIRPPYQIGDILYVREAWAEWLKTPSTYAYKADGCDLYRRDGDYFTPKWRPSIHMPKEAARIFLRVTDVWIERLQEILKSPPGPDNQVVREGCEYTCDFIATWENTIKKSDRARYGWDASPWVYVISFEKMEVG